MENPSPVTCWGDVLSAIKRASEPPLQLSNPVGVYTVTELGDVRRLSLTIDLIPIRYEAADEDVPF